MSAPCRCLAAGGSGVSWGWDGGARGGRRSMWGRRVEGNGVAVVFGGRAERGQDSMNREDGGVGGDRRAAGAASGGSGPRWTCWREREDPMYLSAGGHGRRVGRGGLAVFLSCVGETPCTCQPGRVRLKSRQEPMNRGDGGAGGDEPHRGGAVLGLGPCRGDADGRAGFVGFRFWRWENPMYLSAEAPGGRAVCRIVGRPLVPVRMGARSRDPHAASAFICGSTLRVHTDRGYGRVDRSGPAPGTRGVWRRRAGAVDEVAECQEHSALRRGTVVATRVHEP